MKYISSEQFLEQPKEVQKVLLDWWKPSEYDLYQDISIKTIHSVMPRQNRKDIWNNLKEENAIIPLLTEGQLREFIEDKTETLLDVTHNGGTTIYSMSELYGEYERTFYEDRLIEIYLQVACELVKEELRCK